MAVLAVVAFHEDQAWAPGGFLGVDVFFVLSGYLITTLLLEERARTGRLDLIAFWARRLRRLLPALVLLVLAVTLAWTRSAGGPPDGFRLDAMTSLGFLANWRTVAGTGYFDATRLPGGLEHLWSLGIEEQFYLVWPVLLLGLLRLPARARVALVSGAAVASAGLMAWIADGSSAATTRAYFGTDTRAQALLVGVALALILARRPRHRRTTARRRTNGLALVGTAALVALVGTADAQASWLYRGGFGLAALAAACLVGAVAADPTSAAGRLLGWAPLAGLGRISYGVYLWHWPLLLVVTAEATGRRGFELSVLRATIAVALAAASYHLVERPARRVVGRSAISAVGMTAGLTAVAGLVAVAVAPPTPAVQLVLATPALHATATTTTRPATTTIAPDQPTTSTSGPVPATVATTVPPTSPTSAPAAPVPAPRTLRVAVLGDSVAKSLAAGLAPLRAQTGLDVIDDAILGCGVARSGDYTLSGSTNGLAAECAAWSSTWAARLDRDRPDLVVIQVGRHEVLDRQLEGRFTHVGDPAYDAYLSGELDTALDVATSTGAPVALLTAPYYWRPERPDGSQWPENDPARADRVNELQRAAAARHPGVVVLELGARTGPGGRYTSTVDGVRLRRDGVHYTAEACAWLAPWLVPQLRALVPGS